MSFSLPPVLAATAIFRNRRDDLADSLDDVAELFDNEALCLAAGFASTETETAFFRNRRVKYFGDSTILIFGSTIDASDLVLPWYDLAESMDDLANLLDDERQQHERTLRKMQIEYLQIKINAAKARQSNRPATDSQTTTDSSSHRSRTPSSDGSIELEKI